MGGGGAATLYTNGDMVLQNPKETVGIFIFVIALTISFEKLIHFLRHNHSSYVRALYENVSEEITILGIIALTIMFVSTSILPYIPYRWFILFEWIHIVCFIMMVSFVTGICVSVLFLRRMLTKWAELENSKAPATTWHHTMFLQARVVFLHHLEFLHGGKNVDEILFSAYLRTVTRGTVVFFSKVDGKCWVSLILLAFTNSVRMWIIPGELQSKEEVDITRDDRIMNIGTFILIIGYIPMCIFLVSVGLIKYRLGNYLRLAVHTHDNREQSTPFCEDFSNARVIMNGAPIWVHPKHMNSSLLEKREVLEDPSPYLLFGSLKHTVVVLQVPYLCSQLYMSMFVVGSAYDLSVNIGEWRYLLWPMALLPTAVYAFVLPYALLMLTFLSALGVKLNEGALKTAGLKASTHHTSPPEKVADPRMSLRLADAQDTLEQLSPRLSPEDRMAVAARIEALRSTKARMEEEEKDSSLEALYEAMQSVMTALTRYRDVVTRHEKETRRSKSTNIPSYMFEGTSVEAPRQIVYTRSSSAVAVPPPQQHPWRCGNGPRLFPHHLYEGAEVGVGPLWSVDPKTGGLIPRLLVSNRSASNL